VRRDVASNFEGFLIPFIFGPQEGRPKRTLKTFGEFKVELCDIIIIINIIIIAAIII
jgi:hypothetical protein